MLETINKFGRVIACGAVSQYNKLPHERYALKNYIYVVGKELTYRGRFSKWRPPTAMSIPGQHANSIFTAGFIITGKDLGNFHVEVSRARR